MDWAGLVVEAVTGRRLESYWQEELFDPLGMKDTVVHLDPARRARTTPVHARGADGVWVPTPINFTVDPEFYAGGHCLHSTAADFLILQQALLNEGWSAAGQILKPATVNDMLRDHLGTLDVGVIRSARPDESLDAPLHGMKWGLGLMVDPADVPGGRAKGSAGWMGGFNTFFWVDRTRGLTAALYTQTIPFFDDAIIDLYRRFETAAYALAKGPAKAG
jgi:CubicO group peptidase (beta-lactamase class C family)